MTDLVFQSKKIARRRNTNVIAIARDGRRHERKPEEKGEQRESGHAEQGGNDIELPGPEHERLFAHEHIANQATADGIHHAHKNAGRNGQTCLIGFARPHHSVGPGAKRINNQEWLG